MRIRYVLLDAYGIGGTVRSVVNQANALCADHEVEIASVRRRRERPRLAIDPRIRLVPLTDRRTPRRLASLTRRLPNPLPHRRDYRFRRWDPQLDLRLWRYFRAADDGVLVTTRPGLSLLAARWAPRHLVRVAQDHRSRDSYHPALYESLVRAYRRLDAVTVLTRADHTAYQEALRGSPVRLELIPNGIPVSPYPARLRSRILVAAGRLEHNKGFDLLLDAFQKVSAAHPDWQLWIFGRGKLRGGLSARIDRLGLTGRARLMGVTRRLERRLRAASTFVLSSRHEGLPMVILEAMAAGVPVVAFDCPTGPAELIDHGRTGLLVPPEDTGALAEAMIRMIEDRAARRRIGAAAYRQAHDHSIAEVARRWEELFADLLEARRLRNQ